MEQFILTRQIICQDQRLSVRKKKKTPRPHLQSVITPGGLSGYPKMLCRRCRSGFLTLSFLCVRLCLCVCACQLVPTLWVGHGAAAGEGQEDSAEDQTFQDETSAEGAPLCRCKAVWMRLFVCVPSLCVHETYLVIGYEQVCVFNRKSVCVCVCVCFVRLPRCCVCVCVDV